MADKIKRFSDVDDLDRLDFDLDIDTPIGATFAAALREQGVDFEEEFGVIGKAAGAGSTHGSDTDADDSDDVAASPEPPAPASRATSFLDDDMDDEEAFAAPATPHAGRVIPPVRSPERQTVASMHFDEPEFDDEEFEDAATGHDRAPPALAPSDANPARMLAGYAAEAASRPTLTASSHHVIPHAEAPADADADDLPPMEDAPAAGNGPGFDYAFSGADMGGDRMLPRIVVHAFCVKPSTLSVMRTVVKDRRLANVSMDVFEGGIPAALEHYVNETTPNLLILEASTHPRQLLAELDQLAQHCDEGIRVVVIGQTNDIRLYRELMRRGVSEYLVEPVEPVQLIRAAANLFSDPAQPFVGRTLAVTGVKGGVGSSSIAHNLAWAIAERFKANATLVDLDLNFGTSGLDFNEEAPATIADALLSPDRFDEVVMSRLITKATDHLSLFTAPGTLDRTYDLEPQTYTRVLELIRTSVPFVVLDLPHIWSDWFKTTIIQADEVVVVAAPDLASLRNGKNLIDFLKAARPNDAPPKLVLNMVGVPKRPEIPAKDFGAAIGIDPALVLPFDPQLFGTAANNGQMIFDVAADSKCAQGIDQLAGLLSGREKQTRKGSILQKILKR